jgi:hypothetical protein
MFISRRYSLGRSIRRNGSALLLSHILPKTDWTFEMPHRTQQMRPQLGIHVSHCGGVFHELNDSSNVSSIAKKITINMRDSLRSAPSKDIKWTLYQLMNS